MLGIMDIPFKQNHVVDSDDSYPKSELKIGSSASSHIWACIFKYYVT